MPASEPPPWSYGPDSVWETYWRLAEPHRETVTTMLLDTLRLSGGAPSLCLWGAGSCHDVDLSRLLELCGELTLVDINRENVLLGVRYQLGETPDPVKVLAPVDLAGTPSGGDHRAVVSAILEHQLPEVGEHDVVASLGMLSQIVLDVVAAYGREDATDATAVASQRWSTDAQLVQSLVAIRRRHLGLMIDHLKPGGHGVAVIDFVNSRDSPALEETEDLDTAVAEALDSLPAQPVLSPQRLHHDLMLFPGLSRRVTDVSVSTYWLWRMPKMSFACYATRFKRR